MSGGVTTAYTYDANGNLLSDEKGIYTYNSRGSLKTFSENGITTSYTYSPTGLRKTKYTAGHEGKRYTWENGNIIYEHTWTSDNYPPAYEGRTYNHGLGLISYSDSASGENMLYELNAHGDVVAITDGLSENANMVYEYDAFGNERYISTLDDNPFRYCGQYYDNETGNYYLRARYYTPAVGRFTQQDQHWNVNNMIYGDEPLILRDRKIPNYSAISQSLNCYNYCGNNPVYYIDPNGEIFISTAVILIVGLATVGAVAGGIYGNSVANKNGVTGAKKAGYIAGGAVAGAAVGAAAGALAAPSVVAATGVTGVSVTAAGVAAASSGASVAISGTANKAAPILGDKLNYIFGKATGSTHNIERSWGLLEQMQRIGINDNNEGRAYITEKITEAYYNAQPIIENGGRYIIDVFIMGPSGGAKMETIWEGTNLITVIIMGG